MTNVPDELAVRVHRDNAWLIRSGSANFAALELGELLRSLDRPLTDLEQRFLSRLDDTIGVHQS